MLTSRTTRKRRWGSSLLVSLVLALAVIVAGAALPGLDQEAAAADAIGCSAQATSFATETITSGADIRVGCAGDAPSSLRALASSDNDIVAVIDFDSTPDHELLQTMQKMVHTTNNDQINGLSLSDSFALRTQETHVGGHSPGYDDIDYDGSIRVVGSSIVIVIPTADFGTTGGWADWWASFWPKFVGAVSGIAITVALAAVCLLFLPEGAVLCGAVSGAIGGGVGEIISLRCEGKSIDAGAWGAISAAAFSGALAGGLSAAAVKFIQGNLATLMLEARATLKRAAIRFVKWAIPLQYIADLLSGAFSEGFLARLLELQRGVGGSSLPTDRTLRVMVVGDSMTQGREGDWTWRYRLWQWFTDQGVRVNFVGPYTGTREPGQPKAPQPPHVQGEPSSVSAAGPAVSGRYAEGALPFDSDHFSVWGRQAAQAKNLIREQVALYQPDLLLVGLGFNDLGWFISNPDGTLDSMKTLVAQARAAKPDIDIALANVPQRTAIGGREDLPVKTAAYNRELREQISSWSTTGSLVLPVDWAGNYICGVNSCPASYDGLHPNALGEYQIAHAFELTLHDGWGIGGSVPNVPAAVPARPTPVPSNVNAVTAPLGITVTWDKVFGARGYTVRSRVVGQDWTESSVGANRFDTTATFDGWQWEYQVRTDNASDGKSAWSPLVTAVAHPQTSPPPTGIVTTATATGLDLAWGAPTGPYTDTIDRYQIIYWDKDTPGAWIGGTAVRGLSAHIDGLVPGHRYQVWVKTWNAAGGGLPGGAGLVIIRAGTPAAPAHLQVTSVDGATVQLKWDASIGAAGYRVWVRNINDGSVSKVNSTTTDTGKDIGWLFPGVWNYEFCVTAFNGAAESGKSNCVVAAKPPGF
ncbi:hypothetical protein GCM10010269_56170 [Streptomyces humidus]|uniref:Fibronectin type-III domain-containing protein n=2 Tax=Streptomyces humidus TaxID=52259 RepID=A0A918FZY6_9ACTN|nr:hypothetical protein GCM10010269_56170 [Streptomyces humidus]